MHAPIVKKPITIGWRTNNLVKKLFSKNGLGKMAYVMKITVNCYL